MTYTSYDLLASASVSGGPSRTFNYGPDRQRYRQQSVSGGITRTYTYIGEHYVKEAQSGSADEHKLYILANGEPVAYVSDDGSPETRYLHKDHLGSITTIITNQNFAGREKLSYDAWGKRRNGTDWWTAPAAATEERGYTGHEHLDNVDLIHMNGRAYDPQLARFTSPDPFVPAPLFSQSYNRYAYVYANPLKHTDPSGFAPKEECRFWMICKEPGIPSPWATPVIPDDGFDFASPQDWAYYFQQQAIQELEQQLIYIANYIAQMNYTLAMDHPAAKTDQEGIKPQPTIGGALKDIGSGLVLGAAGFVPYLGDALDVYDVVRPSATVTDRAIAGGSLALNAWTLGLAPNAGPIVRGGRRIGSGASDLFKLSEGAISNAANSVKRTARSTMDKVGGVYNSITRGISKWGGIFSSSDNAAGGRLVTSEGVIDQSDFATHVNSGVMRGENVEILSGVHGAPDGTTVPDRALLTEDIEAFGGLPGVTVHDFNALSEAQKRAIVNGPGTVIGGFCNSDACLAPLKQ